MKRRPDRSGPRAPPHLPGSVAGFAAGDLPVEVLEGGGFLPVEVPGDDLGIAVVAELGGLFLAGVDVVAHQAIPGRLIELVQLDDALADISAALELALRAVRRR